MGTILSVIPPVLTIVLALWSKNIIISLFAGIVLGSFIVNGPANFIPLIVDEYMTNGFKSNTNVLICMILIGIMLEFVKRAGGFKAFAEWCQKKVNTPKQTLVYTFWFSMLFSIATNLGSLTIPRVMKVPTLQNKMNETKVPMICTSVINAMSSLLPITNFILFFSGLIVSAVPDQGFDGYTIFCQAIPFQFFAILSIITTALYAYGIIPDLGLLKKTASEQSEEEIRKAQKEAIETLGGDDIVSDIYGLVIPFGCLIAAIPLFSLLAGKLVVTVGIFIGTCVSVIYAIAKGRVRFSESMGAFAAGFRQVAMVFLILLFAFTFGQVVSALGFSQFVISVLGGSFSGKLIPMFAFIICCLISYPTGSLSASAVIVFPLAVPLALSTGISIPLTVGAIISGSHFGDLFSPVSDSVILPASAMGVDPVETSKALVPYRMIQFVITCVLYLIAGYIF